MFSRVCILKKAIVKIIYSKQLFYKELFLKLKIKLVEKLYLVKLSMYNNTALSYTLLL